MDTHSLWSREWTNERAGLRKPGPLDPTTDRSVHYFGRIKVRWLRVANLQPIASVRDTSCRPVMDAPVRVMSCRIVSCWATFSISHGTQDLIPSTKCPSSTHPQSWTIHHICFPHHFPLSTTCICGLIRTHKMRAKTGSFAVWTFRYLMRRVHDQITHKTKSTGNISTNY